MSSFVLFSILRNLFYLIKVKRSKHEGQNLHQIEAGFDTIRQPAQAQHSVRLCELVKYRPGCTLTPP